MKLNKNKLMKEAIKARLNSYSPYSNFKVGAALITKDGRYFYGTNIENSSFGLTCCAERNCLFNAYSNGAKKDDIIGFAIVADTDKVVSPCGACRQVMSELLNIDTPIFLGNLKGEIEETTISDLLPYFFKEEDMK